MWGWQRFNKLSKSVVKIQKLEKKSDFFCFFLLRLHSFFLALTYSWINTRQINIFFKIFKSNMTVCSIIHTFCKVYEREIVSALICRTGRTISGSQLLQNRWIIKQTIVSLWKFQRKYRSVSYSFSCTNVVKTNIHVW